MNFGRALLFILASLLPAACITGKDSSVGDHLAQTREVEGVPEFPPGRYVHAVNIEIPGHGSHQMRGVLKLADSEINLVGLSPMGTTVFRIDDRFDDADVTIEVFQNELKPHQEKILGFYQQLRPFLAGRRLSGEGYTRLAPEGWDVKFYESGKTPPLPPTIAVRSEKFSLSIEVDQYEP